MTPDFHVEPTLKEHLLAMPCIESQKGERWQLLLWSGNSSDSMLAATSRTLWQGEYPIASVGVMPQWRGCADIWSQLSPLIYYHPVVVMRFHIHFLEYAQKLYQLERVQAHILENNEPAMSWLAKSGFVDETPNGRPKWMDGRNYHLLAKTWEI